MENVFLTSLYEANYTLLLLYYSIYFASLYTGLLHLTLALPVSALYFDELFSLLYLLIYIILFLYFILLYCTLIYTLHFIVLFLPFLYSEST